MLREVAADLAELNRSLRGLNASIGHYIDRLTRNRTPEQVLELFGQYEEQVVAAAYHRFKTSDNLSNYRSALEEGLEPVRDRLCPCPGAGLRPGGGLRPDPGGRRRAGAGAAAAG